MTIFIPRKKKKRIGIWDLQNTFCVEKMISQWWQYDGGEVGKVRSVVSGFSIVFEYWVMAHTSKNLLEELMFDLKLPMNTYVTIKQ